MQTLREQLVQNVKTCEDLLVKAKSQLYTFDSLPENNVFDTFDNALAELEDAMRQEATEDCEGAYNCGNETYTRQFKIKNDPKLYEATLHVQYNRHDKTYYFIDETKIEYREI